MTVEKQIAPAPFSGRSPVIGRLWLVPLLVAVNVGVYVFTAILSRSFLAIDSAVSIASGARLGYLVFQGEWWRLLTAMFLHADLPHLAVNLYLLVVFGRILEPLLGAPRLLLLYLLSGLAGNVMGQFAQPLGVYTVGASGAIFGLAGGILAQQLFEHRGLANLLRRPFGISLVIYIVLVLLLGEFNEAVDKFAHLGGLVCGLAAGHYLFSAAHSRNPELPEPLRLELLHKRRLALGAAVVLTGAGLLYFAAFRELAPHRLARYYFSQGDLQEVVKLLERQTEKENPDPAALYGLGEIYEMLGDYKRAADAWRRSLESTSGGEAGDRRKLPAGITEAALRAKLAEVYAELNQPGPALSALREQAPVSADDYIATALAYQQLNQSELADSILRRYLVKHPKNLAVYERLLELYLQPPTHDLQQATLVALEIQKVFPQLPRARFLEGRVHETFCDYRRALEFYLVAKEGLAGEPEWWYRVGLCQLRLGEWESAAKHLEQARNRVVVEDEEEKRKHHRIDLRFLVETVLHKALRRAGQPEKAQLLAGRYVAQLRQIAALPPVWSGQNGLAYFLALIDDAHDDALEAARQSVDAHAGGANLDTLAWVHYRRGEYAQALDAQRRALERTLVKSPELMFHLGAIHQALGQFDEARKIFQELLDAGLDFDERPETRERLKTIQQSSLNAQP